MVLVTFFVRILISNLIFLERDKSAKEAKLVEVDHQAAEKSKWIELESKSEGKVARMK